MNRPAALLAAAGSALFACLVYPYAGYPLVLRWMRQVPVQQAGPTDESRGQGRDFAVLFCAYNEARSAHDKLVNIAQLKARARDLEVLVFDDGSTDGCADTYASRPDLLRCVRGGGRQGKAFGMKQLVKMTDRDILIFTDANVMLDADVVKALQRSFSDPRVGGVCGNLIYQVRSDSATETVGGAYWKLDQKLKFLESRTGNVMGGDGSIFAIRRHLYPDFPDTVQDDFTVTMSVVFAGQRLIFDPDVRATEQLVSSRSEEYRRKVRIAARAYHTHTVMRARVDRMSALDRWKYSSHKIMRWWGGVFLAGSVATTLLSALLVAPAAVTAGVAVSGVATVVARKYTNVPDSVFEVVVALMATTHGVVLAKRGATFSTWTPAATR